VYLPTRGRGPLVDASTCRPHPPPSVRSVRAAPGRQHEAPHRDPCHPQLLPHDPDARLRECDRVQPAGDRSVGPHLQVHQLLRLVRRVASQRVRPARAVAATVRVDRGDRELPAGAQGGGGSGLGPRPRQSRVPDVRRRDRTARRRASSRRRVPARGAPPPARFQDRDHTPSASTGASPIGTRSPTRRKPSTCGSPEPASTATRGRTWASW
jgi:hypothetical protein